MRYLTDHITSSRHSPLISMTTGRCLESSVLSSLRWSRHFASEESGASVLVMGTCEDGVARIPIPDAYLSENGSFWCYVYNRTASSGKTIHKIKIPVMQRAELPAETVNPSEDDSNYFAAVLAEINQRVDEIRATAISVEPYLVEFDSVRNPDYSYTHTCRNTFEDVKEAYEAGRYIYAKNTCFTVKK